jgi:MFS family permease
MTTGSMTTARLGPQFTRLWAASTISSFGDGVTAVAAALLVASLTPDPVLVSGAVFAASLPWLLFALPSGALVDRMDRRRVMVVVDCLRAAAICALAASVALDRVGIPLIYAVMFLLGTGQTLFTSASMSLMPALVPAALLERANSRLVATLTVARDMLAGPAGGLMFAAAAALPFFVDGATFLAGALLVALLPGRFRAAPGPVAAAVDGAPPARRSLRAEISEGLRWLARHRLLRTLALLIGLLNVTLTAGMSILVLVATRRLGLSSVGYGALFTAMSVGILVGSVLGERLIRTVTATVTLRVGLLVETATHLVLAVSTSAYPVAAILVLFGVHAALWTIVSTSLRQRLTPPAMLGRVNSVYLFVAAGCNAFGALLGGALAGRFGLTAPFWLGFVVAAAVTAATWRVFDRATIAAAYAEPAAANA